MVLDIGVAILVIAALALALFLVFYTFYVRIRQSTFTEKRFNFVALWSCTAVAFLAIHAAVNIPIIEAALAKIGLSIAPADKASKIIVAFIAGFYVWTVARWAQAWNGLLSEEGYRAREQHEPAFFLFDGAQETWRIIRRDPPPPIHQGSISQAPQLPPPMSELTFQEQVRDLVVGRWPELVIDDNAWIADGSCWHGRDTGLEEPLLVVCGLDETEVNFNRLAALVARRKQNGRIRLITVLEKFRDKAGFAAALAELSGAAPDVYTFEDLIRVALPLARYRHEIDKQFQEDPLPGADFSIANVFVPVRAYETEATTGDESRLAVKGDPLDLESHVANWTMDASLRHLALLGTYGQGKSTAALALTHKLLHDPDFAARCNNRVPLLIRLTGLSPKTTNPERLLGEWGYRLGLNGRALLALHRAGRTVLILDAFDEMANVADRADRFDHFATLWQFTCPGSKVVFTGRPNFFLDDEELKRALGISEGIAVGPYCSALQIALFEPDQIAGTLRWMLPERVAAFMRALDRLPQLVEIARRPSLLFQVSRLWHEGRINIEGEDVYSGTVIRTFVTYSLERQIQKQRTEVASGRLDRQFIPLTLAELDYFTCGCAVAALSEGRNNSLPQSVFRATTARLLEALPEGGLPRSPGESGSMAMPLKERLADRPDPTDACVQAVRTHGVIEHDPAKAGMYKFSHKSFAEALAAEVVVCRALRLQRPSGLIWDPLRPLSLMGQDTILVLSMDIAAAARHHTTVRTGPEMMANISGKYSATTAVYMIDFHVSLPFFDILQKIAYPRRSERSHTTAEHSFAPLHRLAGITAKHVLGVSAFIGRTLSEVVNINRRTFRSGVHILALEYAIKKPRTDPTERVLRLDIYDELVESRIAAATYRRRSGTTGDGVLNSVMNG